MHMLYAIAGVLLFLWFAGLITSYTLGGYLHILLLLSIAVIIARLVLGERNS